MRTLVAMATAAAAALLMSLFLAQPAATWVTGQFTYESPDEVGDLHAIVYMALNVLALCAGFAVGWAASRSLEKAPEAH